MSLGDLPGRELVRHLRERAANEAASLGSNIDADAIHRIVERLLDDERHIVPDAGRRRVVQAVVDEVLGLGPLEVLLRDPTISEVMVNGPSDVYVERDGRLERSDVRFDDAAHVVHTIDRLLAPLGRRIDEASPMVDARLHDGSRVNAIIPPLSLIGPVLTIRRFGHHSLDGEGLVQRGTLSRAMLTLLRDAVRARRNILVTGGTGSGKTTTLAAICSFVPDDERLITIEDAAELRLTCPHVVRLESRPASLEGRGAVPIRALVRNALRMRPDRIIVGEVRGGECVDMLAAMTTGHEGSLSTLHASSPEDAIRRLQTLALMGDVEIPYAAVADQVAHAIDLVVHQARMSDGRRRIVEIAAVTPDHGATLTSLVRFRTDDHRDGVLVGDFDWQPGWESWAAENRQAASLRGGG